MKRIFTLLVAMMLTSMAFSQNFGVKAGFNSTTSMLDLGEANISTSMNGFYVGLLTEFDLSEMVNLQPELQYVYLTKDGENASFLNLPIMFGYKLADNFTLQAGPQLTFDLGESEEDFTNFGVDLGVGAKYGFTENIFVDARYILGVTNRYTGEGSGDLKAKYNSFQIGIGYKF